MQKPTIFFIDDSPMITQFLTIFFEKNYNVYSYHNPLDAIEDIKNGLYPDIVVTDFDMPELNGLEFIKAVRQAACYIPVIVVSGMRESKYRLNCLEAGADDFMAKPFHPAELEIRINKLLEEPNKANANGTATPTASSSKPSLLKKITQITGIF
jgi:DNA-binding response OmpR family regulator